jgi:hypothetical protein
MCTVPCRKCAKSATAGLHVVRASCSCGARCWLLRHEHDRVRPKSEDSQPLKNGGHERGLEVAGSSSGAEGAACGLETRHGGVDTNVRARWSSLCIRWVAWGQRRAGTSPLPWIDTLGAERRAARLLRYWASRTLREEAS